jgi:hypothetical protein
MKVDGSELRSQFLGGDVLQARSRSLWRNFFGDNICLRSQENGDKMRYK